MVVKKIIPNLNVEVSTLGFGGMRFPQQEGNINQELLDEMVDYAVKNGINYFDTAYMYHNGKSESAIGKSLGRYPRDSYFIADKMPAWLCHSKNDAEKIFNEQLKRTGLEYFDFYLAHSLEPGSYEMFKEYDLYHFIKRKQQEGYIKYLGFSFHGTPKLLEEILNNYQFDFVQIQLNYYDWTIQNAKELYEILDKHHLPCIVMEGVRGGFLANFNDKINNIFKSARSDYSIASWALRWLISLPNVYIILSGMSNMEQLMDNINTFTKYETYTDNDYQVLNNALNILNDVKIIPCTGCHYCMPCPYGVDIPRVFAIYNDFHRTNNKFVTGVTYNDAFDDQNKPYNCHKCLSCVKKCPQHINIPEQLAKVDNEFKRELD